MDMVNFCGNQYLFDDSVIHSYLLEKGIIMTMMESNKSSLVKMFDVINNAFLLLKDVSNIINDDTVLDNEFKFLENCCDEIINNKIVDITKKCYDLDVKKRRLNKLWDEVNYYILMYPNLASYLSTNRLKIENIINDTIVYKLIAI